MSLSECSARFFFELSLGLFAGLVVVDRRTIGPGFTRLTIAFVLASLLPAALLARSHTGAGALPAGGAGALAFAGLALIVFAAAGRIPSAVESALTVAALVAGSAALVVSLRAELSGRVDHHFPLLAASALGSMLVLGLVTGAMILGHWYLVTPDLPVAHLGRMTRVALASIYVKLALLAATGWLFADRFAVSARGFGAVLGFGGDAPPGNFHQQLDLLYLVARVAIGLVGPAILCHMTLATVKLRATQPATGILYAATVMVLMGELFAYVGEQSFAVVL